ncbi:MAG: hypothetical protein V3575_01545 [Candidatus Absconditabacteria bacterium]
MILYHISFLIKIIVGSLIIYFIYPKINVYQEPMFAIPAVLLGIFFLIWGLSFFIIYISKKIISQKPNIVIASNSFKLSLFFSLFIILNLILIIMHKWTKLMGFGLLILFVVLQILTIKDE